MYNYVLFEGDEIFKPILNRDKTESRYLISNFGTIYDTKKEKYMKPTIETKWSSYTNQFNPVRNAPEDKWRALVNLSFDDWTFNGPVARLVLMTFKPLDDYTNMECDHINNDPKDDRLDNLQWLTSVENKKKAAEARGRTYTDYSEDTVRKVIEMLIEGKGRAEIADALGVNPRLVNDIMAGRSHKKIAVEYLDKGFRFVKQTPSKMYERQQLVKQICELIDFGKSNAEIRAMLNLPSNEKSLPNDIRKLRVYRHISKDYKFYRDAADDKKDTKYFKRVFI